MSQIVSGFAGSPLRASKRSQTLTNGGLIMKSEEALKQTEQGIDELIKALEQGKSETLLRFLEFQARFHEYSFRNCLLIAIQRPDATYVAGFQRWKDLGRFVKKGEKGIAILAPIVRRRKANDDSA